LVAVTGVLWTLYSEVRVPPPSPDDSRARLTLCVVTTLMLYNLARESASNFKILWLFQGATMPVVPINDVKTYQPATYKKGERLVRCKLASVYRLVDIFGWNRGISNHVTARVTREGDEYLINPLGLRKVFRNSRFRTSYSRLRLISDYGFWLQVSCTKTGLLPISQEAMILGETAIADEDAATRKERRFSADCMLLMIRNHGLLAMGQSIEEAWFVAFNAVLACESQVRNFYIILVHSQQAAHYVGRTPLAVQLRPGESVGSSGWRRGELEFEALMRRLDAAGYRTGHWPVISFPCLTRFLVVVWNQSTVLGSRSLILSTHLRAILEFYENSVGCDLIFKEFLS
uniref:Aldolase_II domain-containing protein n=1 Tax=Echinostoma caproni TaxID=27848 RepID=A0A183AZW0_9TREM